MKRAIKWSKEQHEKFAKTMRAKKAAIATQATAQALASHGFRQKMADAGANSGAAAGRSVIAPELAYKEMTEVKARRSSPRYPARLAIYGKRVTIHPQGTVIVEDWKT